MRGKVVRYATIIMLVVVALLLPVAVLAQEEGITLEGLAEQVETLGKRVSGLEKDVRLSKRLYTPPAVRADSGECLLAASESRHPSTVAAYMALTESQISDSVYFAAVWDTPGGETSIILRAYGNGTDAYVAEQWGGCEFQSHSRFWEEDYNGNVTYPD